ncbi:aldo/keto reductase [Bacillus mesophilum]|uniref:Aldo/keto reductase n=1 Tax=Bacillus mesophilum TaxID=1071718 RepID=A0A7V7RNV7_9BACI|nr:aldo/keto reductase [Bacillus mesophilum]KAB2333757.1 aldo/keto reductase [Bacillus mesophilum]
MEKRQIGTSELHASVLGLGCMSLGTDLNIGKNIIDAALDAGVNYFDTADLYDFGENEKIVGQALKPVRDKVIIATKAGNRWNENKDGWSWDPSKKHIKEAVKHSLQRLQTDYIDLYQLHGGTIEDNIEETIEAFEELVTEGYIRYYGISSIRPNVIREYAEKSNIVSVMMQYSMLDRRPEEQAFPLLEQKKISAVTRGPLAKGILNGNLAKAQKNGYLSYCYEDLQQLIPSLEEKLSNRSPGEIAMQFNLAQHAVASVIAGASSVEQVQQNAAAVRKPVLSMDELKMIQQLTSSAGYSEHR